MTPQAELAVGDSAVVEVRGMHRQQLFRPQLHVAVTLLAVGFERGVRCRERPRVDRCRSTSAFLRLMGEQRDQQRHGHARRDLRQNAPHPAQCGRGLAGRDGAAAGAVRQRPFFAGFPTMCFHPCALPLVTAAAGQTLTGLAPVKFHPRPALAFGVRPQVARLPLTLRPAGPALVGAVVGGVPVPDVLEFVCHAG